MATYTTTIGPWSGSSGRKFKLTVTTEDKGTYVNLSMKVETIDGQTSDRMDSYLYLSSYAMADTEDYDAGHEYIYVDRQASWQESNVWFVGNNSNETYTDFYRKSKSKSYDVHIYIEGYIYNYQSQNDVLSITIPQLAGYTVHYNANGGTGAPADQEKYKGTDLKLSSTKPTRTGYDFAGWSLNGTTYQPGDLYKTDANATFTAIWTPTPATINSITGNTIGSSIAVKWTPKATGLTYKLKFECGSWSYTTGNITPGSTAEYTYNYTIPNAVAAQMPDAASKEMTVTLYTGSSARSKTITIVVPNSMAPTISSFTNAEGTASGFGVFVKTLSTVRATVSAAGVQGATIKSAVMEVEGAQKTMSKSGNNYVGTSDKLSTSGSVPVKVTVTDSRGKKTSQTKNITVYDYFKPSLSLSLSVDGTTVTIKAVCKIAPVNNLNSRRLVITRKKAEDGSDVRTFTPTLSAYNQTVTLTDTVATVDVDTYDYTAVLTDAKGSTTVTKSTGVVALSMFRGGTGATFGAEATEKGFHVQWPDINTFAAWLSTKRAGNNYVEVGNTQGTNNKTLRLLVNDAQWDNMGLYDAGNSAWLYRQNGSKEIQLGNENTSKYNGFANLLLQKNGANYVEVKNTGADVNKRLWLIANSGSTERIGLYDPEGQRFLIALDKDGSFRLANSTMGDIYLKGVKLDYPIEEGTSNNWYYKKWANGDYECYRTHTSAVAINTSNVGSYCSTIINLNLPITLTSLTDVQIQSRSAGVWCTQSGDVTNQVQFRYNACASLAASAWGAFVSVKGKWK